MSNSAMQALQSRVFYGRVVDLYPLEPRFAADVARLRNQEKARHFLTQHFELTEAEQLQWIQKHGSNANSVVFVALNKQGETVGTFSLYNYDGETVELGRLVFDLTKTAGGVPYTLDSAIMVLDMAFDRLGVKEVFNTIREDNHALLKFAQSLGFCAEGTRMIKDVPNVLMRMRPDHRLYLKYNDFVDAWVRKRTKE